MKNKKLLIIVIAVVALLGGAYKTVLAKPAKEPEPKVEGTVYVLGKEFLINLKDGRFAKLTAALVLSPEDTSAAAAHGEGAATPPEGYGTMSQEALVRSIVTDDVTNRRDVELIDEDHRAELEKRVLKDILKQTDVKAQEVLFTDVTVQ